MTLTASFQKVFSSDPRVGFFTQRNHFQDALDRGEGTRARQGRWRNGQVVLGSPTIDGLLAAFFAVLIIIVLASSAVVWVRAIRAGGSLPTTEVPYQQRSRVVAPARLWATSEEKRQLVAVGGHDGYGELPPEEAARR